ncbi:MAG: hypothetical protein K8R85_01510 [Bacteroidetes bacterium]|nr:hypothetical protein [Bacteroidota bacterium]
MATRGLICERIQRQIYNNFASDDATITLNLINSYLNDAIGIAVKANYKESIQADGIGYVNNSFYATFKGIAVTKNDDETYKLTLPQIPFGIGKNEGVATLQFKKDNEVSQTAIPISINQVGYAFNMRPMQNKIIYWTENQYAYVKSTLPLYLFTATVRMISGGISTDLDSVVNVPDEYYPIMVEYIKNQLLFERQQPIDTSNDGVDKP